ncbi:2-hydroxychromene-2-carboxylate isomerase, partial [Paramuricea clavata]
MKEITFYYDIVCPFAYVASRLVERLAERNAASIRWAPVLLGGLYKENQSQSPMQTSCDAKKKIISEDFTRTFHRYNVTINFPASHPMNSLSAMRLLAATPDSNTSNIRRELSHALFSSYWIENKDLTSSDVLQDISKTVGWNVNVEEVIQVKGKTLLKDNTKEALDYGAFGVPSFVVNGKLFWGVDNMHLVEKELGNVDAALLRLVRPPTYPQSATLTIYHDLASPWSFIGSTQIEHLVHSLKPVNVKVESVPIVVGSLFKQIGTPVVPMRVLSPAKLAYLSRNLQDWCDYHGIKGFRFPSHFPLRTVLPMRVLLANDKADDRLQAILYKAAWIDDKDVGDKE